MARLTPDPTFYPSADMAMAAPPEKLATWRLVPTNGNGTFQPMLLTLDVDPTSAAAVRRLVACSAQYRAMRHHFGWNACSSALCPTDRTRTSNGAIR
jgi:selenium-binding protein 1